MAAAGECCAATASRPAALRQANAPQQLDANLAQSVFIKRRKVSRVTRRGLTWSLGCQSSGRDCLSDSLRWIVEAPNRKPIKSSVNINTKLGALGPRKKSADLARGSCYVKIHVRLVLSLAVGYIIAF